MISRSGFLACLLICLTGWLLTGCLTTATPMATVAPTSASTIAARTELVNPTSTTLPTQTPMPSATPQPAATPTSTATPHPTATPTPEILTYTSTHGTLIYHQPGEADSRLAYISGGLTFRVEAISSDGDWYLIALGSDQAGWVSRLDGILSGDSAFLVVATPVPSTPAVATIAEPAGVWISASAAYSDKQGVGQQVYVAINNAVTMRKYLLRIYNPAGKEIYRADGSITSGNVRYFTANLGDVPSGTYRVWVQDAVTGVALETKVTIRQP